MASNPPHKLILAGSRVEGDGGIATITNPYSGNTVDPVCLAGAGHIESALAAAQHAAASLLPVPRHQRSRWCAALAEMIHARAEEFAWLIMAESGKPIQFARAEVARAVSTFKIAAHEALRFTGEVLPLDITPASENYRGYSEWRPRGPVTAISPFNFPLNLVAHKIAPAIACGCPVILKPAPQTPLTALLLGDVMMSIGLPEGSFSILPTSNELAEVLVRDDRMQTLSFTGSAKVGWYLKSIAGKKKVALELGGNAPAIVHGDADLDYAVSRLVTSAFGSAGQVCIKAQRILVQEKVFGEFLDKFQNATEALAVGDPSQDDTVVGPVIDAKSAYRIMEWVQEAIDLGAELVTGHRREDNLIWPTILTKVPEESRCNREEVFGPVTVVRPYATIEEAIRLANDTAYGLQAAVFSYDARVLEQAAQDLQYGGVIINDSPSVRVDNFPYGGVKDSGLGREGVRYAMEDFCDRKVIIRKSTL